MVPQTKSVMLCFVLFTFVWISHVFSKSGDSFRIIHDIIAEAVVEAMKDRPTSGTGLDAMYTGSGTRLTETQDSDSATLYKMFAKYQGDEQSVENFARCADIVVRATHIMASRDIKGIQNEEFMHAMAPFCPKRMFHCDPSYRFRAADGSCNNFNNPLWGASMIQQNRYIAPTYSDIFNLGLKPRIRSFLGGDLPNPRNISNAVFRGGNSPPKSDMYSHAVTYFGEFISHDVTATPNIQKGDNPIRCCINGKPVDRPECFAFETPRGEFSTTCMNFIRSELAPAPGCPPGKREQVNQVTSYLDLSVVYGSSLNAVIKLREPGTGRLLEGFSGLLPDGLAGVCKHGSICFQAGEERHSENPSLTVFHTIFLREHNRIVEILRKFNPHWDGELLFQEARKINIAVYQHIIYNEYLPAILGKDITKALGLLPKTEGFNTVYNPNIDGTTKNAFASAAFRFGHSLIGGVIEYYSSNYRSHRRISLDDGYFDPRTVRDNMNFGIDRMVRWMVTDFMCESDRVFASSVRDRLFQTEPNNGFDLTALNIQRGRDHGLPSYNKYRMFCGLSPALSFDTGYQGLDTHDNVTARALNNIYRHPEDIDLYVGGMTELPMKGALIGPTFGCLIGQQFINYKYGDRFYYENNINPTGFTKNQLNIIKNQTLSAVFCRTSDVSELQRNSFEVPNNKQPRTNCRNLPQLGVQELKEWKE